MREIAERVINDEVFTTVIELLNSSSDLYVQLNSLRLVTETILREFPENDDTSYDKLIYKF